MNFMRSLLCVTAMSGAVSAFAATDTSCENEDNVVNPTLALCSVHAYNVGATENLPEGGDKEMMKEVIAMKTTVITQQMFKQHEYLESMMKRFKTQLEKAVLTTKLQAAGASDGSKSSTSSSDNSSYNSSSKNATLDGTEDCSRKTGGTLAIYQCLQSNTNIVLDALDSNNVSGAQKQLNRDLSVATRYSISVTVSNRKCLNVSGRQMVQECAVALMSTLNQKIDDYNKEFQKK